MRCSGHLPGACSRAPHRSAHASVMGNPSCPTLPYAALRCATLRYPALPCATLRLRPSPSALPRFCRWTWPRRHPRRTRPSGSGSFPRTAPSHATSTGTQHGPLMVAGAAGGGRPRTTAGLLGLRSPQPHPGCSRDAPRSASGPIGRRQRPAVSRLSPEPTPPSRAFGGPFSTDWLTCRPVSPDEMLARQKSEMLPRSTSCAASWAAASSARQQGQSAPLAVGSCAREAPPAAALGSSASQEEARHCVPRPRVLSSPPAKPPFPRVLTTNSYRHAPLPCVDALALPCE